MSSSVNLLGQQPQNEDNSYEAGRKFTVRAIAILAVGQMVTALPSPPLPSAFNRSGFAITIHLSCSLPSLCYTSTYTTMSSASLNLLSSPIKKFRAGYTF